MLYSQVLRPVFTYSLIQAPTWVQLPPPDTFKSFACSILNNHDFDWLKHLDEPTEKHTVVPVFILNGHESHGHPIFARAADYILQSLLYMFLING